MVPSYSPQNQSPLNTSRGDAKMYMGPLSSGGVQTEKLFDFQQTKI